MMIPAPRNNQHCQNSRADRNPAKFEKSLLGRFFDIGLFDDFRFVCRCFEVRKDDLQCGVCHLPGISPVCPQISNQIKLPGGQIKDIGRLNSQIFRFPDCQPATEGDHGTVNPRLPQMIRDVLGGGRVRHPHEYLGVAIVEDTF